METFKFFSRFFLVLTILFFISSVSLAIVCSSKNNTVIKQCKVERIDYGGHYGHHSVIMSCGDNFKTHQFNNNVGDYIECKHTYIWEGTEFTKTFGSIIILGLTFSLIMWVISSIIYAYFND